MIKRLSVSLLLMGLAAFGLGAAAFAWFSDSETGNVAISTGSPDISILANQDCDGDTEGTVDGTAFPLNWGGIVPGDTTRDCFIITNEGDGDLTVFVKHDGFAGNSDLLDAVTFFYDGDSDVNNGGLCNGLGLADANKFVTANGNRGCELGTVSAGDTLYFETRVAFVDSGNQNALQNTGFTFNAIVTGYTG